METAKQKTCKELVGAALKSRMEDIATLWEVYQEDSEEQHDDWGTGQNTD